MAFAQMLPNVTLVVTVLRTISEILKEIVSLMTIVLHVRIFSQINNVLSTTICCI